MLFPGKRDPREMGAAEVERFLSDLNGWLLPNWREVLNRARMPAPIRAVYALGINRYRQ